ncbi:ComF family protein [Pseudalkalibacillus sp. JSM 102089]|uniref:ComF family protein n=1 Tax=Pseudalkalibacillus sp. JSM 102089 TaxID=3229856 RepID=UPI0035265521
MAQLNRCPMCGEDVSQNVSWSWLVGIKSDPDCCELCRKQLVLIEGDLCRKCGRPLNKLASKFVENQFCSDCRKWEEKGWGKVLIHNKSFYEYNAFLKNTLALYKFRGDVEVGRAFSHLIQKELKKSYSFIDQVIPMPTSKERLYERGFNQCEVWIEGTSFEQESPLIRIKNEEKQSKLSREKRMNRTEDMFRVTEGSALNGKKILLLDDLYTTGTTIHYAALTLRNAGVSEVYSLTLSRG